MRILILNKLFGYDGLLVTITNFIWNLLLIGILWLVCSLPIVTIGASTTAAYYAIMKTVRKKYGYTGKEFFSSFVKNIKSGIVLGLLFILCIGFSAFLFGHFLMIQTEMGQMISVIAGFCFLLFLGMGIYLFPNLSRFHMKIPALLKLSSVMEFRYLFRTIAALTLEIVFVVTVYLQPWMIFLTGFLFYGLTFLVEPVLQKCMPNPQEGTAEAELWYYK